MDSKVFNAKLAKSLDMTPKRVGELLDAFADILQESARTATAVAVPSFGSFVPVKVDEEITVDRSSGRRVLLPPQITVEFHAAAMLRKKLNSHE